MKKKTTLLTLFTLAALMSGCGSNSDATNNGSPTGTPSTNQTTNNGTTNETTNDGNNNGNNNETTDATTGPSWATDEKSLETAVIDSWIVIVTKYLNTTK